MPSSTQERSPRSLVNRRNFLRGSLFIAAASAAAPVLAGCDILNPPYPTKTPRPSGTPTPIESPKPAPTVIKPTEVAPVPPAGTPGPSPAASLTEVLKVTPKPTEAPARPTETKVAAPTVLPSPAQPPKALSPCVSEKPSPGEIIAASESPPQTKAAIKLEVFKKPNTTDEEARKISHVLTLGAPPEEMVHTLERISEKATKRRNGLSEPQMSQLRIHFQNFSRAVGGVLQSEEDPASGATPVPRTTTPPCLPGKPSFGEQIALAESGPYSPAAIRMEVRKRPTTSVEAAEKIRQAMRTGPDILVLTLEEIIEKASNRRRGLSQQQIFQIKDHLFNLSQNVDSVLLSEEDPPEQ